MCGIFGIFGPRNKNRNKFVEYAKHYLSKRGPDEFSYMESSKSSLLGHARLSIVGQNSGKQPMQSFCKRYTLVFNGEIYNYKKLNNDLISNNYSKEEKKYDSDTRTFIESISFYGIEETIKKYSKGTFVVAIYDHKKKQLTIANDNFAEKPLYYFIDREQFIFCSRLLPIANYLNKAPDIQSLEKSLLKVRNNFPDTIFPNIKRLGPGSIMKIDSKLNIDIESYMHNSIKNGNQGYSPKKIFLIKSNDKYVEEFEKIISRTINEMIPSNQKVSCLLSGGIDSSLISIYLAKNYSSKLDTFTVSFPDQEYDESKYAKQVSSYIKSNHNEYLIRPEDLTDIMDNYIDIIDEPFGDSSLVPSAFIFKKIKSKNHKVVFAGDGGDELFFGYERYRYLRMSIWLNRFPYFIRKYAVKILEKIINIESINLSPNIRYKLRKSIENGFHLITPHEIFENLTKQNQIFNTNEYEKKEIKSVFEKLHHSEMNFFRASDIANYMYEDTLVKTDSASMASSVEVRLPFLHPDLASFALGLDYKIHMHNFKTKSISRNLLEKHMGSKFVNRAKQGFSLPLDNWLRNSLNIWMNEKIKDAKLLIESDEINAYLDQLIIDLHSGERVSNSIWPFITLGCWYNCVKKQ